jgi:hypothetical protein
VLASTGHGLNISLPGHPADPSQSPVDRHRPPPKGITLSV